MSGTLDRGVGSSARASASLFFSTRAVVRSVGKPGFDGVAPSFH